MMSFQPLYGAEKMYRCLNCGHIFEKLFALFFPKCPVCGSHWVMKVPTAC
jgi:DNA-directed RNA polymerase subunit RPC12/RpoP